MDEFEDEPIISDDDLAKEIKSSEHERKRLSIPNKKKMRNLQQYKNLTDDEFNEIYAKKLIGIEVNREFEYRIKHKIDELTIDYDIADLNSNDKLVLRGLAQALISLEDYENLTYNLRAKEINTDNILVLDKLNKIITDLRGDISKFQDDLKITRKVRKNDKEVTILTMVEDLKKKAKEFYEAKMGYIYCPKCHMLLGTIWTLYPEEPRNKIALVCNRKYDDGSVCGEKVIISTKDLLDKRGTNYDEIPESMR